MTRPNTAISVNTLQNNNHPQYPTSSVIEMINANTEIAGSAPWYGSVFDLQPGEAAKISAYGLAQGDLIVLRQVYRRPSEKPIHGNDGCGLICPTESPVIKAINYIICSKEIKIDAANPTLWIKDVGSFQLVYSGNTFANRDAIVTMQKMPAEYVTDGMMKCCC